MKPPIDWLLEGGSWIEYRTRCDLLGQAESAAQVQQARKAMLVDKKVKGLVTELKKWPGTVIASHKSAGQPFHKLTFLADLGLQTTDPGVDIIVKRILTHRATEGPFQLPTNIPAAYGANGRDTWAWALCDAPLSLYALNKFGLEDKPAVRARNSNCGSGPASPDDGLWLPCAGTWSPHPARSAATRGARQ